MKALAVNGDFILAGGGNNAGVHISTNNGSNWVSTTLNNKSIYSLALIGNYVYAGTGSGVYRSTDSGYTWTQSTLSNELIYSVAVYDNYVFAGSELNGVYLSGNNGLNWIQINEGLGNATIYSLYIFNNYIFAGASANSVYRRPLGELVNINTNEIPVEMKLSQNYPNPFNPLTTINFDINRKDKVTLKVYDILGKLIATLVNKTFNPGSYSVNWNASQYQSGIYFYRLETGNFTDTKRMILIK